MDLGTKYGERTIRKSRTADEMKQRFESKWFYQHGAAKSFSADLELYRLILQRFLTTHNISLNPRTSRYSNKTGSIERNKQVFKSVIDKLQKAVKREAVDAPVARASFITSLIWGNKCMNALQLAKDYSPSVFWIRREMISQGMVDSHLERESRRAIETMIKSQTPKLIYKIILKQGIKVFVYHRISKPNKPNEWIEANIQDSNEHIITCKTKGERTADESLPW